MGQLRAAQYACAWDTGRAAVIQQPIQTLTYFARGVVRLGDSHHVSLEVTGSDADSSKQFSANQYTANATNLPWAYPLNALTAATYNQVFNAIRAAFDVATNPNRAAQVAALDARYGRPIAGRWRCIVCGPREYETNTKTFRVALGVEGPLWADWTYRAGASYARSEASSVLGTGYYYRGVRTANDPPRHRGDERGANDPRAPTAPGAVRPGHYRPAQLGHPQPVQPHPDAMRRSQALRGGVGRGHRALRRPLPGAPVRRLDVGRALPHRRPRRAARRRRRLSPGELRVQRLAGRGRGNGRTSSMWRSTISTR